MKPEKNDRGLKWGKKPENLKQVEKKNIITPLPIYEGKSMISPPQKGNAFVSKKERFNDPQPEKTRDLLLLNKMKK